MARSNGGAPMWARVEVGGLCVCCDAVWDFRAEGLAASGAKPRVLIEVKDRIVACFQFQSISSPGACRKAPLLSHTRGRTTLARCH
jgi:hypothetical protein